MAHRHIQALGNNTHRQTSALSNNTQHSAIITHKAALSNNTNTHALSNVTHKPHARSRGYQSQTIWTVYIANLALPLVLIL